MNNFTKEELEDIANCIWIYDDMREDSMHAELLKKVQSMIGNYCEHKNDKAISDVDYVMVCADCDETLGFI